LRLTEWSFDGQWIHFHLQSRRPKREVVIVVSGRDVQFTYSMHDPGTRTMITYQGPYGDPARDQQLDVDGLLTGE
jgi:hypothetical protein